MSRTGENSPRLVWLEAYLAAYKLGSYAAVDREMALSAGTASKYVKLLEAWFHKPLFQNRLPLVITEDGLAFIPNASKIIASMYRMKKDDSFDTTLKIPLKNFWSHEGARHLREVKYLSRKK